jgi:prevent-host-death family protein
MGGDRSVSAARFKTECLALLDDVAQTGEPLTITKQGRPIARIVPLAPGSSPGSGSGEVPDDELIGPARTPWDIGTE